MYKLKEVEILGFWGSYRITTSFHNNVNIFIGENGSGKTTFLKLMQAVLSVDIEVLSNLQYDKIVIKIVKDGRYKKIQVYKNSALINGLDTLSYQISTKKFIFPSLSSEIQYSKYRNGRVNPRLQREIEVVKAEMGELVELSFLSVYREDYSRIDDYRNKNDTIINSVDIMLMKLMDNFTSYQLLLEKELNDLSEKFQKEILKLMLFDPEFDKFPAGQKIDLHTNDDLDIDTLKNKLIEVCKDLKIFDNAFSKKIDIHINSIIKSVDAVNSNTANSKKNVLYINDVTPLALLNRTRKIVTLSNELQADKNKVLKPINDFLDLLKSFITGKTFTPMFKSQAGLKVQKGRELLPLSQLSSGEKQIIILLTETLLQKNKPTIFLADEPELSLHISWQKKIFPSLISLNPNAQFIVATHSPEIIGKWADNIINMGNIIYE